MPHADPETRREYQRKYQEANRVKLLAQRREYRYSHSEHLLAQARAYREQNRATIARANRRYRERNADAERRNADRKRSRAEGLPAPRTREPWTDTEMSIATRSDLTVIEAAAMLGRSPYSIQGARHKYRKAAQAA